MGAHAAEFARNKARRTTTVMKKDDVNFMVMSFVERCFDLDLQIKAGVCREQRREEVGIRVG